MNPRPSEERIWRKFYPEGLEEGISIPEGRTLWDFFGSILRGDDRSSAVWDYYGTRVGPASVLERVESLSRSLSGLGVKEGEPVLCYFASTPLVLVMLLALNRIGAVPLFMNPTTTGDNLRKTVRGIRFAFVNDVLFDRAPDVFNDDTFEKVVVARLSYGSSGITRIVMDYRTRKSRENIRYNDHVIRFDRFLKDYSADVAESAYKEGRPAIMSCSSGSTGIPKVIIDSDRSVISSAVITTECVRGRYDVSKGSFNFLPPFASTSLDILTFVPLILGVPIHFVSVVTPADFNRDMLHCGASATLTCGTNWASFARRLRLEIDAGRRPDLSSLSMPVLGGDGVSPKMLSRIDSLLAECGCRYGILSGYGQSEAFSVLTACFFDGIPLNVDVPGCPVGIPIPGYTVGIFDEEGNELDYGVPGELRYKGPSVFEDYYNADSSSVKVDGWVRSGDCCILDKDGCLHVLGRYAESVTVKTTSDVFHPFIIERVLETDPVVFTALAFVSDDDDGQVLRIHVATDDDLSPEDVSRFYGLIVSSIPVGIDFGGFLRHEVIEPNPLTFKADKERYRVLSEGFVLP